jgi:hypothetical protein
MILSSLKIFFHFHKKQPNMKIFKNITTVLMTALTLSAFVVSCDNTSSPINSLNNQQPSLSSAKTSVAWKNLSGLSLSTEDQELNNKMNQLAKAVAITLSETQVQKELHKKVMQRFDGDTEILWNDLNTDQTMTNSLGSGTLVNWTNAVAKRGQALGFHSQNDVQTLLNKSKKSYFANVHLFWYNAEKWDGKTAPLVTFIPMGADLEKEKITTLTGFDAEGNMYQIDRVLAEKHPVIVIGPNERTKEDGTLLDGISMASVPTKNTLGAQTHSTVNFQLDWLSFNTWSADEFLESWFSGGPEFFASISVVNPTNNTLAFEYARWNFSGQIGYFQCDGRILGGWTGLLSRSISWNTDFYRTFNFRWFEYDAAVETESNLSFPFKVTIPGPDGKPIGEFGISASVKTKITQKDDILDVMTIDYTSPSRYFGGGRPNMQVIF